MPDHHVKGQPTASTYVREKGCLKNNSNRDTLCISAIVIPELDTGWELDTLGQF